MDLGGLRPRQIEIVERLTVRGNRRLVRHTVRVLPARRLGLGESPKRFAIGLRRLSPISSDGIPAVTQTFFVGVPILRDNRGDAIRVLDSNSEAYRRAVVEHVYREPVETDHFRESVDHAGDVGERIGECAAGRHVRLAEARQVGCDEVEAIDQERDEIAEHMAGAGKAMKQKQNGRTDGPSLTIENLEPVDIGRTIFDSDHGIFPD